MLPETATFVAVFGNFCRHGVDRLLQSVEVRSRPIVHELEREGVEVKTVSPTHIRMAATSTKSAFCALRDLHEISVN